MCIVSFACHCTPRQLSIERILHWKVVLQIRRRHVKRDNLNCCIYNDKKQTIKWTISSRASRQLTVCTRTLPLYFDVAKHCHQTIRRSPVHFMSATMTVDLVSASGMSVSLLDKAHKLMRHSHSISAHMHVFWQKKLCCYFQRRVLVSFLLLILSQS